MNRWQEYMARIVDHTRGSGDGTLHMDDKTDGMQWCVVLFSSSYPHLAWYDRGGRV